MSSPLGFFERHRAASFNPKQREPWTCRDCPTRADRGRATIASAGGEQSRLRSMTRPFRT